MKLSIKLLMTPGVVILFMLISGAFSFWGMRMQQSTIQEMHSVRYANNAKAGKIMNDIDSVHNRLYRLVIWSGTGYDQKKVDAEITEVQSLLAQTITSVKAISAGVTLRTEEQKFVTEIVATLTAYSKSVSETLDMMGPDINAVMMFLQQADDKYVIFENTFNGFMKLEALLNDASHAQSVSASQKVLITLAGIIFISIMLTIILSYLINRIIMAPIHGTVQVIESMAGGNLTRRIDVRSSDEIGNMARHINEFINSLQETIRSFASTSVKLASASAELSNTSEQMAHGAEQVANQSAAVATAGEEMTATSRDISQNCQLAAEGSLTAMTAAESGAAVVGQTVTVMGKIAERVQLTAKTIEGLGTRSDQIGAIIGTIEDIADQTNLLALNAAIEAARAGEQGRGFAVVADEVRALAERTTRATREIGEMIKSIQAETRSAVGEMEAGVREVQEGTGEASRSGDAIRQILAQIESVNMQVNQIATAAEEQTATTSEISGNMHQITDVVQQTSHGAQESFAAANSLSALAAELQCTVSRFQFN
ncbi:MAG: methyl-accepting chemotaxis protein [Desulfuromonadaceae bacterium]|nr:methyl-accepting chemotaxis protein [Desulfuromonadaceae bacterium]MDD5107068.1 methyl-accepting chemotaxis protein [Desulfuromonadaceae bacterium]